MKKNKLTPEETIIVEETLAVLAERDPELLQEWLAVALRLLGPIARMLGPSLKNLAKTHGPKIAKELAQQAAQVAKEKGQAAAREFFEAKADALINKAKTKLTPKETPKEDEEEQPPSPGTASAQDAAKPTSAAKPPTNEGLSKEKTIIMEEIFKVLNEAHCNSAHGRDTAIMPMGGPMASAIAPLPPIGSPIGGCGGGDPHVSKTHKEYDDAYMLKKSLEIMANQALALHDAINNGMTLPSWAEAKVYCAADDIKGVHANLDRGGVASGPQAPIIQLAEGLLREQHQVNMSKALEDSKTKGYIDMLVNDLMSNTHNIDGVLSSNSKLILRIIGDIYADIGFDPENMPRIEMQERLKNYIKDYLSKVPTRQKVSDEIKSFIGDEIWWATQFSGESKTVNRSQEPSDNDKTKRREDIDPSGETGVVPRSDLS